MHAYAMENSLAVTPKFCHYLYLGGILILDSGVLLAFSLSCSYNFKDGVEEQSCTQVHSK